MGALGKERSCSSMSVKALNTDLNLNLFGDELES